VIRTRKIVDRREKKRGSPYRLGLCPIRNLSSNERPGYDQILSSCKSLVQLWPRKIIGDFHRRRPGTILLGDGFRQPDTSEELLLPTRQVSSAHLIVLATHKRRRTQKLVEPDPHTDGVAGSFEDDDLGVAQTHGGRLLRGLRKMDGSLTERGPVSAEPCEM
jgi:hypothetical protein